MSNTTTVTVTTPKVDRKAQIAERIAKLQAQLAKAQEEIKVAADPAMEAKLAAYKEARVDLTSARRVHTMNTKVLARLRTEFAQQIAERTKRDEDLTRDLRNAEARVAKAAEGIPAELLPADPEDSATAPKVAPAAAPVAPKPATTGAKRGPKPKVKPAPAAPVEAPKVEAAPVAEVAAPAPVETPAPTA